MTKYIDQLKEYYDFEDNYDDLIVTRKSDGVSKRIQPRDVSEFFSLVSIDPSEFPATADGVMEWVKEGKAIKIYLPKLMQEFYGWTDKETEEIVCMRRYNYDVKTKKYFESIRKSLGFIMVENGYDKEKFKSSIKYDNIPNTEEVEFGQVEYSDIWCAELGYQTNVDDYNIERHYFKKELSFDELKEYFATRYAGKLFLNNDIKFKYFCDWCEEQVHWLDRKGGIDNKINGALNRRCGGCKRKTPEGYVFPFIDFEN